MNDVPFSTRGGLNPLHAETCKYVACFVIVQLLWQFSGAERGYADYWHFHSDHIGGHNMYMLTAGCLNIVNLRVCHI